MDPGSVQRHRRRSWARAANCTVAGESEHATKPAPASSIRRAGGQRTRRWSLPGLWRVRISVSVPSASSPERLHNADSGPKASCGALLASDRSARLTDAKRAATSARA